MIGRNLESICLEMPVKSVGFGYLTRLHDLKTQAVNKTQIFSTLGQQALHGPVMPAGIDPYDFQRGKIFALKCRTESRPTHRWSSATVSNSTNDLVRSRNWWAAIRKILSEISFETLWRKKFHDPWHGSRFFCRLNPKRQTAKRKNLTLFKVMSLLKFTLDSRRSIFIISPQFNALFKFLCFTGEAWRTFLPKKKSTIRRTLRTIHWIWKINWWNFRKKIERCRHFTKMPL